MYKNLLFLFFITQAMFPFTYFKSVQTLDAIKEIITIKKKGAFLRFGDGDFALAHGVRSGTHEISSALETEMREAFAMNDGGILKTLPLLCREHGGAEVEMFYVDQALSETNCIALRNKAQKIWGAHIDHVYCPVALPYTAVFMPNICLDFLMFIRKQHCALFVGNGAIPHETIHFLFGDPKIVGTPAREAYPEIDRIEQECLRAICQKSDTYRVLIISCGNTGRVLIKRLWPKLENVFFFDIGSLMDALCGWPIRQWIRRSRFNHESFLSLLRERLGANFQL